MISVKRLAELTAIALVPFGCSGAALAQDGTHSPIVVELFTSESCSSCPPADALLSELRQARSLAGSELILLSEHVDYWNDTGWQDRFSSPAFSERQGAYETALRLEGRYTPQFVIDGRIDAPGNDAARVRQSIQQAAQTPKPAIINISHRNLDHVQIGVQNAGSESAQVLLAVTEDDLSTAVSRGENGGRTLRNSAVVRVLHNMGHTANGKFEGSASLDRQDNWQQGKLRLVVLVQRRRDLAIIGAASEAIQ